MGCISNPRQDHTVTTPRAGINFLFQGSVAVARLAMVLPMVVGCDGVERRSRPVVQAGDQGTDKSGSDRDTKPVAKTDDGMSGGRRDGRPDRGGEATPEEPTTDNTTSSGESDANSKPAEVPDRLDDVTKWEPTDFASAKIDKDPKLAEAVAYVDEKYRGKDKAADMLFHLLTLDDPPPPAPEGDEASEMEGREMEGRGGRDGRDGRSGRGERDGMWGGDRGIIEEYGGYNDPSRAEKVKIDPELAAEVVAVLGRNNSTTARKHLHNLATGAINTPLDPMALFKSVLYAMVDNGHSEHEETLFILATEPEKIIRESDDPNNYSTLSVSSARNEILQVLGDEASMALRTQLAQHLEDPNVPIETAEELEQLLSSEDDRNLPAQILLYQNIYTSESTYAKLEPRLVQRSRAALGHLMGIDDIGGGGYGEFGRGGRGGFESGRGRGRFEPDRGRGTDFRGRGTDFRGRGTGIERGRDGALPCSLRDVEADPFGVGSLSLYQQPAGRGRGIEMLGGGRGTGRPSREGGRPPRDGGRPPRDGGQSSFEGRAEPTAPVDPQLVYGPCAKLLWTDPFVEKTGAKLIYNMQTEQLQLLATIPTTAARAKIAELVDRYQDDPSPFSQAGLFGRELADPSFLLVAKDIYHGKKARRGTRGRTGSGRGRLEAGRGGARGGGMIGGREGRGGGFGVGEDDPDASPWLREVEQYVVALGEQFANAESTWTQDAKPSGDSDGNGDEEPSGRRAAMGVPLHTGAEIAEEYHLRWPDDATSRLPGVRVAPLEIHYVRIEQEARPSKMLTAYKRHTDGGKTHDIDGGVWLDGLVTNRTTGAKRSVDIRIYSEHAGNNNLRPTEARDMIVEILVITIPGAEPKPTPEPSPPADEGAKDSEKT